MPFLFRSAAWHHALMFTSSPPPPMSRRTLGQGLLALWASLLGSSTSTAKPAELPWRMPDEAEPHRRTWMAYGASRQVWDKRLLPVVQDNLITLANTIAQFEPVTLLVRPEERASVAPRLKPQVSLLDAGLDDLWIRDTGPVFVQGPQGQRAGVDFNFNGWGDKQAHAQDALVAERVCRSAGVARLETELVLEGGGIEVDGHGTAIITESCVLNANRNPGMSRQDVAEELQRLLGIRHIIWLPGIAGEDITDGHTDFYARFSRPGAVLAHLDPDPQSYDHAVTREHLAILRRAKDASGQSLQVSAIEAPTKVRPAFDGKDFTAGYINFYVCNGAVISPEFGDPRADAQAQRILAAHFPGRHIVAINIDGIAAGGGGIHCATQQEPR